MRVRHAHCARIKLHSTLLPIEIANRSHMPCLSHSHQTKSNADEMMVTVKSHFGDRTNVFFTGISIAFIIIYRAGRWFALHLRQVHEWTWNIIFRLKFISLLYVRFALIGSAVNNLDHEEKFILNLCDWIEKRMEMCFRYSVSPYFAIVVREGRRERRARATVFEKLIWFRPNNNRYWR